MMSKSNKPQRKSIKIWMRMTLIKTNHPPHTHQTGTSPSNSNNSWFLSSKILTTMNFQVIQSTRNRWRPGSQGRACGKLADLIMNSRTTSRINRTLMIKLARTIKNQAKSKTSILKSILIISLRENLPIRPTTINHLPTTLFWQEIQIAKIRFQPMINLRAF